MDSFILKSILICMLVTLTTSVDWWCTNHLCSSGCKRYVTIESVNYLGRFWRHCSNLGFIDDNNLNNKACDPNVFPGDVTFLMREPGLTGENGTVSFESANYPGRFLRHQNYRIKLHPYIATDLYIHDATFRRRVPGRFNSDDFRHYDNSFESVNYPGFFIRHCSNELFINNNRILNAKCDSNNDVFLMDITFHIIDGRIRY